MNSTTSCNSVSSGIVKTNGTMEGNVMIPAPTAATPSATATVKGGIIVTPIMTKIPPHKPMTGWKSGFEFQPESDQQQQQQHPPPPHTTSRLRKVANLHPPGQRGSGGALLKGNFQKKNKVADAPDLLMVVNARPEMKERATAEAKARQIKKEEHTMKKMRAKVVVNKPPPKQAKAEWTNVLKPSKKMTSGTSAGRNSRKKSKKPSSKGGVDNGGGTGGRSDVVDWQAVYQDIVSPTSGNHKFVAKQDLAPNVEKVSSPKKKVRGRKSSHRSSFPVTLPLDGGGFSNHSSGISGYDSADTMSRDSSMMDDLTLDDDYDVDDDNKMQHQMITTSSTTDHGLTPSTDTTTATVEDQYSDHHRIVADVGGDVFVDLSEYQDDHSEQTMEDLNEEDAVVPVVFGDDTLPPPLRGSVNGADDDEIHPQQVNKGSDNYDEDREQYSPDAVAVTPPPQRRQQLILEFSVPPGGGGSGGNFDDEGGYGEGDYDVGLEVPVEVLSFDDMSSVDSWPSIDSDDSYDTKMNKMMQRWVDIHGGYDDHRGELGDASDIGNHQDSNVHLDDNVLDHIVLAASDLEKAMEQFEQMTGITPTHVGPLQGLGAKTAHVGLDNNRYIEILAPDLDSPGPLGDELKTLEEGTLVPYHYSIRSSEVSRLIEGYVYDVLGWDPDHIAMVQALPDNSIRQWDLLTMYGHDMGGVAPYYVRWNDPAHHPTASIPLNAILVACTVRAPENHDVHKLITGVGGINIEFGDPMLECSLSTPKGVLTFSASSPKGLVFPGYDDEPMPPSNTG